MNWPSFLLISLLLTGSLCLDVQPRKHNIVSKLLKKFLDPKFEELTNTGVSLGDINLGTEVGRFANLKASSSGGLTSEIDGRDSWGFSLKLEMKEVQLGAQYDIKYLELPKLFPIYGKGDLEVAIERINLDIVFAAFYNLTGAKFNITIPTFNVSAGTSKVQFESLMDNPAVTDFLNELISDLVPDLVTILQERLRILVEVLSGYYGNGILNCVRTQLLTVDKCINDFIKGTNQKALPTRLAGIVAEIVRKNFLKYNSTK